MNIEYSGEAERGENGLQHGYVIEIRPFDEEAFDAVFLGVGPDDDGYLVLAYLNWDDERGEGVGPDQWIDEDRVREVYVY